MAREWFELRNRDGRTEYLHSRTGIALSRPNGASEEDWAILREAFFCRFPRAREIRKDGLETISSVDRLPRGEAPVFSPGDRIALRSGGQRSAKTSVVAIQMPFPGCGEASYLLKDGRMLSWSGRAERWVVKEAWGFEPTCISMRPRRAAPRRKAEPARMHSCPL